MLAVYADVRSTMTLLLPGHPGLPNLAERYAWSNGSVDAYRRSAALLAENGKRLVVSLKNGFRGAAPIAAKFPPCAVPLDDFVAGMQAGGNRRKLLDSHGTVLEGS